MRELLRALELVTQDGGSQTMPEPPANDRALQRLETQLSVSPLPALAIELYGWHNGGAGDRWLGGGGYWTYFGIETALELVEEWSRCEIDLQSGTSDSRVDLPPMPFWPSDWIPFADWNGDVFLIADYSKPDRVPVLVVDLEGAEVAQVSESMEGFFRELVKLRASGLDLDVNKLLRSQSN